VKLEELVNELELPLEERDRLALVTDDHEVVFIVLGEHEEGVVVAPHRRESLVEVFLYGGIHLSQNGNSGSGSGNDRGGSGGVGSHTSMMSWVVPKGRQSMCDRSLKYGSM